MVVVRCVLFSFLLVWTTVSALAPAIMIDKDGNLVVVLGDMFKENKDGDVASKYTKLSIRTSETCREVPKFSPCQPGDDHYYYDIYKHRCRKAVSKCPSSRLNSYKSLQKCRHHCEGGLYPSITVSGPETCRIEPRSIICDKDSHRYSYDLASHSCVKASGKICPSGVNSFATEKGCQERCEGLNEPMVKVKNYEVCRIIPKFVACTLFAPSYFYDVRKGKCGAYILSACPVGANAFRTLADCRAVCHGEPDKDLDTPLPNIEIEDSPDLLESVTTQPTTTDITTVQPTTSTGAATTQGPYPAALYKAWDRAGEVCLDARRTVTCSGDTWEYSPGARQCVKVTSSRCSAVNTYQSNEDCEKTCAVSSNRPYDRQIVCREGCAIGLSVASENGGQSRRSRRPTFHCDWDNPNLYLEQPVTIGCQPLGSDVFSLLTADCSAPKLEGSCKNQVKVRRWYYDVTTGGCKTFSFYGCGGNTNNFPTKEACDSACPAAAVHPCLAPPDRRSCSDTTSIKYYYNPFGGECRLLKHGGCTGSTNTFKTMKDCRKKCAGVSLPVNVGVQFQEVTTQGPTTKPDRVVVTEPGNGLQVIIDETGQINPPKYDVHNGKH